MSVSLSRLLAAPFGGWRIGGAGHGERMSPVPTVLPFSGSYGCPELRCFRARSRTPSHPKPRSKSVEGRSIAVVMRTPGHDRGLAAGFLLSEGVILSEADVFEISICPSAAPEGGVVDVLLARPEAVDFSSLTLNVFTSSSCGVCGRASIDAAMRFCRPLRIPEVPCVDAAVLFALPGAQRELQKGFSETGGLHATSRSMFPDR